MADDYVSLLPRFMDQIQQKKKGETHECTECVEQVFTTWLEGDGVICYLARQSPLLQ